MVAISVEKTGNDWTLFRLENETMDVAFLNYGGIITEINTPDQFGKKENIVLAYNDMETYKDNPFYFGAVIGRVAGRVKDASLRLEESVYALEANEGRHHLHGGSDGFHQKNWAYEIAHHDDGVSVIFTVDSVDGESGYPGHLAFTMTYTLTNDNQFTIAYQARTDRTTVIAPTNHSYFNLSGDKKESVDSHQVTMQADRYLSLDDVLIARNIEDISSDSPFDFTEGRLLADGFASDDEQIKRVGNGYDHYFLFAEDEEREVLVRHPKSGRRMRIQTDEPGFVMYTFNTADEAVSLQGGHAREHMGVCFETQKSSAALWLDGLPSISLGKNESYQAYTTYTFYNEKA